MSRTSVWNAVDTSRTSPPEQYTLPTRLPTTPLSSACLAVSAAKSATVNPDLGFAVGSVRLDEGERPLGGLTPKRQEATNGHGKVHPPQR